MMPQLPTGVPQLREFSEIWSKGGGDIMLEEAKAHSETLETIYKEIGVK